MVGIHILGFCLLPHPGTATAILRSLNMLAEHNPTTSTDICDSGETCLWMSVGCRWVGCKAPTDPIIIFVLQFPNPTTSIGCDKCDGGTINGSSVGANPNSLDRCGSGMKATVNDPLLRTTNRECVGDCIGSDKDWTKFNPVRSSSIYWR